MCRLLGGTFFIKACYREICRDGSRPIRTSGRAQRIQSRRMARGFLIALCFWRGSKEGSRPLPTNNRMTGGYRQSTLFRQVCRGRIYASRAVFPLGCIFGMAATGGIYVAPTGANATLFLIYYFLFIIYKQNCPQPCGWGQFLCRDGTAVQNYLYSSTSLVRWVKRASATAWFFSNSSLARSGKARDRRL